MKTLTRNTLIVGTVLGLGIAGLNLAAAGPYGGRGGCSNGGGNSHPMGMQAMDTRAEFRAQRSEQHLASIKLALAINAEQESAWNTFADARRARIAGMASHRQQMMQNGAQPAQARMQARVERMEQKLAQMKQAQTDLQTLYSVLTPEQQRKADTLLAMGPRHRPL